MPKVRTAEELNSDARFLNIINLSNPNDRFTIDYLLHEMTVEAKLEHEKRMIEIANEEKFIKAKLAAAIAAYSAYRKQTAEQIILAIKQKSTIKKYKDQLKKKSADRAKAIAKIDHTLKDIEEKQKELVKKHQENLNIVTAKLVNNRYDELEEALIRAGIQPTADAKENLQHYLLEQPGKDVTEVLLSENEISSNKTDELKITSIDDVITSEEKAELLSTKEGILAGYRQASINDQFAMLNQLGAFTREDETKEHEAGWVKNISKAFNDSVIINNASFFGKRGEGRKVVGELESNFKKGYNALEGEKKRLEEEKSFLNNNTQQFTPGGM